MDCLSRRKQGWCINEGWQLHKNRWIVQSDWLRHKHCGRKCVAVFHFNLWKRRSSLSGRAFQQKTNRRRIKAITRHFLEWSCEQIAVTEVWKDYLRYQVNFHFSSCLRCQPCPSANLIWLCVLVRLEQLWPAGNTVRRPLGPCCFQRKWKRFARSHFRRNRNELLLERT